MSNRYAHLSDAEARGLAVALAVSSTIQEMGSVVSGTLWVALEAKLPSVTFETYENIIRALVHAKLVTRSASHVLTWVGPRLRS